MSPGRSAFSLLEVVLAVTIAAIVMCTTTLGMSGLSGENRLRAAATDLGSLLRLSRAQANSTGRPVKLRFRQNDCELLKPLIRDGEWVLASMVRRELPGTVRVEKVAFGQESERPHTGDLLSDIWVHPEGSADLTVTLHVGQRRRARSILDAWVGLKGIVFLGDDQN